MHLQLLSTWLSPSQEQAQNWIDITPIKIHILDVDVQDYKLTSLPQHGCLLILKLSPQNQDFSSTPRQLSHVQRVQRSGCPSPSGHLSQHQLVGIDQYREIRLQSLFCRHFLWQVVSGTRRAISWVIST
jgi:hypothetical protein